MLDLPRLVVAVCVCVPAGGAMAATPVRLVFDAEAYEASYSQAVPLVLTLQDDAGTPLNGAPGGACGGSPCRVSVTVQQDDEGEGAGAIVQVAPDVAVGQDGTVRVRLTLVNGRHGGATFAGDDDGVPYTIAASFTGSGAPLPAASDADCQPGQGVEDGRLCPVRQTSSLSVTSEVPGLSFAQDVIMDLGDEVTLAVTLIDADGDADVGGEAIDGSGVRRLEGLPVVFFYDVDQNGRPDFDEQLGQAVTNSEGVAAFTFTADPSFVVAGVFDAGLHAEFPGDSRYGVARASTRLTVNAGGPVASATIIEVDPGTIPAASGRAAIRVRLVDAFGNILGPDAAEHDVEITTDFGTLVDPAERNPLDGTYEAELLAPRGGGTATITVTVDGEAAGTATLIIDGPTGGCGCTQTADIAPLASLGGLFGLVGFGLARRRRRGA